MKRASLVAVLPLAAGCALIAGGLDQVEEPAHDAGASADADESSVSEASRCPGWVGAFRRRAPIDVVSDEVTPIADFQQRVVVDTSVLSSTDRLRSDAADLQFASRDGRPLSHWVAGAASATETEVWVRMDLPVGSSSAWVYYDDPDAMGDSSMTDTFVRGVVDDPRFELGAWTTGVEDRGEPPSRTNEWSVAFEGDGTAHFKVFKQARPNGTFARACATMVFPSGAAFAVDADVDITIADNGSASILLDDDGAAGLDSGITGHRGLIAQPIPSGTHTICLAAGVIGGNNGGGVDLRFSRPRVRRIGKSRATVDLAREERCE